MQRIVHKNSKNSADKYSLRLIRVLVEEYAVEAMTSLVLDENVKQ